MFKRGLSGIEWIADAVEDLTARFLEYFTPPPFAVFVPFGYYVSVVQPVAENLMVITVVTAIGYPVESIQLAECEPQTVGRLRVDFSL